MIVTVDPLGPPPKRNYYYYYVGHSRVLTRLFQTIRLSISASNSWLEPTSASCFKISTNVDFGHPLLLWPWVGSQSPGEFVCWEVGMSLKVPSEPHPSCCYFISNLQKISKKIFIGGVALPGNIQGHSQRASIATILWLGKGPGFTTMKKNKFHSGFEEWQFYAPGHIRSPHLLHVIQPLPDLAFSCFYVTLCTGNVRTLIIKILNFLQFFSFHSFEWSIDTRVVIYW